MLELDYYVEKKMVYYARKAAPIETCALLFGEDNHINEYYPMLNMDQSEVHFTFDPQEQNLALKGARRRDQVDIGVFHSHPDKESEAYPSPEDVDKAAPGYKYFILNFTDDQQKDYTLRAFEIDGDDITKQDFEVLER
jgi:proteasome lid subunit RPN8/RPN11